MPVLNELHWLIVKEASGFANFIDEWSQFDFCFTNFGVKYQTFQHVVLSCIHYREGYTKYLWRPADLESSNL